MTFSQNSGDTFDITYVRKVNDEIQDLPEGYDFAIGIYKADGTNVGVYKLSEEDIQHTETGTYVLSIDHELSTSLEGNVTFEMVIYDEDKTVVKHFSDALIIHFTTKRMNSQI